MVGVLLTHAVLCAADPADPTRSKRPTLGVALAGGAALGLAHIGTRGDAAPLLPDPGGSEAAASATICSWSGLTKSRPR